MGNIVEFNFKKWFVVFLVSLISISSCSDGNKRELDFSKVEALVSTAIEDTVFPGAVVLVGYKGEKIFEKAFGRFTYFPDAKEVTTDAIFDLASVTKVIGTTSAAMILFDEG